MEYITDHQIDGVSLLKKALLDLNGVTHRAVQIVPQLIKKVEILEQAGKAKDHDINNLMRMAEDHVRQIADLQVALNNAHEELAICTSLLSHLKDAKTRADVHSILQKYSVDVVSAASVH